MPATATVADWRSGAIDPWHSGRGHGPLLLSMIHRNGPWLGEGRQAVSHRPRPGTGPAAVSPSPQHAPYAPASLPRPRSGRGNLALPACRRCRRNA